MRKQKPLGPTIAAARKAAGLTQTELGKKADVPHGQRGVSDIERGEMHVASWRLLERIRAVLLMR